MNQDWEVCDDGKSQSFSDEGKGGGSDACIYLVYGLYLLYRSQSFSDEGGGSDAAVTTA